MPHYIFDKVMSLVESKTATGVWKKGKRLGRRAPFVERIRKTYPSPLPHKIAVEIEPAIVGVDGVTRFHEVFVYRYSFIKLILDQLNDPEFFSNLENCTVNPDSPYAKYVPQSESDPEIHAGKWWQETFDLVIKRAEEEFLLTFILFIDKAGASNDAQQRYGVEPVLACLTIKRKKHRNSSKHWFCLGYMPDLEQSSSALKRKHGSLKGGFGYTTRNYHKCMEILLQPMIDAMEKGFYGFVHLGNQKRLCHIWPVLANIMGDGKSHDQLSGRVKYLQKGTKRMTPACTCSYKNSSDAWHRCSFVPSADIDELNNNILDSNSSKRTKKQSILLLKKYATYQHKSAFRRAVFGSQILGLNGALANDFMHMFELGVFGYKLHCFVGSMTDTVRTEVDEYIEFLFKGYISSDKKNQHRTNFSHGCTQLTLMRAHEWPGVGLSYLMMLLTKKGQQICKSCFLADKGDVVGQVPEDHSPEKPLFDPENLTRVKVHPTVDVDDSKTTCTEEDEASSSSNDEESGSNKKKLRKKAKPLNCTHSQFVDLLEEGILLHAWYKYVTADWGDIKSLENISLRLRQYIAKLVHHVPRREGTGWHLQKLHGIIHLVKDLQNFRHESNFDASAGEKMLRFFVKFI